MNLPEYAYYLGLSAKRFISLKNQKRLPFRVISIGNITVGGTGKTPATIAIAEEAKIRGLRPIILTRGYKGTAAGPCFVTKGDGPLLSPDKSGDEPYLMADMLKGVPIIKSADRYEGGMFAIRELGIRNSESGTGEPSGDGHQPVFILDDGFQHWKLCRDRDIVLVDAQNPFGNHRLLPSGRLREPLSELKRAHVIAVTKTDREDMGLVSEIRKYNSHAPVFFTSHKAVSARFLSGAGESIEWLKGRKVFGFCGLADPEAFRRTIRSAGADLCGFTAYPDHHLFTGHDISAIRRLCTESGAELLITTAKDMVKLRRLDLPENILIIEIKFTADRTFFDSVFA